MADHTDDRDPSPELPASAESDISALLDGELHNERLLATIDELVESESCRTFYRQARALDGLIAAAEPTPAEEPPHHVWSRIADATGISSEAGGWGAPRPRWLGPLIGTVAATVLVAIVAFGVRSAQRSGPLAMEAPVVDDAQLDAITIGGKSGQMTDERFLALAEELLGADQHYRREMAEIILAIESSMPSELGSLEPQRTGDGVESSLARPGLDAIEGGPRSSELDVRIW
jgi:negative regulator of sigma E activity